MPKKCNDACPRASVLVAVGRDKRRLKEKYAVSIFIYVKNWHILDSDSSCVKIALAAMGRLVRQPSGTLTAVDGLH